MYCEWNSLALAVHEIAYYETCMYISKHFSNWTKLGYFWRDMKNAEETDSVVSVLRSFKVSDLQPANTMDVSY